MRNYNYIRENFYKKYEYEEIKNQLIKFINQDLDLSNLDNKGKNYNKIINTYFEKNIYSASTRRCGKISGKSPNEALYDDGLLDKIFEFISTKPNFYTGDDIANLKTFFRNAGKWASKVSNFSPNVARKIYEKYCPKQEANILDYSCGFGSRMLGCLSSKYNYTYWGIDPNTNLYKNLNEFGRFINEIKPCNYKLYCQGSEIHIEELENKIDLAFSSPPYFDLEKYCDEETQSINKYPNYEDWKEKYVRGTIKNIYKYLKKEGLFIFNIKNLTQGNQEPLANDWINIAKEEGFTFIETVEMKHQAGKTALGKYKTENGLTDYTGVKEPLFIFIK